MKRVLIITYYWPPGSGPGVQRWLKMSKLMPESGVKPTILTVANGSYPSMDHSLIDDVPADFEVITTKTWDPFRLFNMLKGNKGKSISVGLSGLDEKQSLFNRFSIFIRANLFIPDARVGWFRFARREGSRILKEERYDLLITTGPPHSTHLIGKALSKEFGIRWLADFRDPWVNVYYHKFMPMWKSTLRRHQRMENDTLQSADLITVVSEGMKKEFQDRAERIRVIPNGFAKDDFADDLPVDTQRFTLSYVGNLLPSQNISSLWQVVGKMLEKDAELASSFRLELIGEQDPVALAEISSRLPPRNIAQHGFIPHLDAISKMRSSSCLLLIIPDIEDNELILTGKLFEYLAAGRPIMAIGPPHGDAARILTICGMDEMIDFNDTEGMEVFLRHCFDKYRSGELKKDPVGNGRFKEYSRSALTRELLDFCGLGSK